MFVGSLAVSFFLHFSYFFPILQPNEGFPCVCVCMGVLSVALHSNELLFNLQSNHKLHNSRFKHSNNQSASERAFRHSSRNGSQENPPTERAAGKPHLVESALSPPFSGGAPTSRHCHLHVQLSAFCSPSFKCNARFFCNFSAVFLLLLLRF